VTAEASTLLVEKTAQSIVLRVPRYTIEVVGGPDAGTKAASVDGHATIGTGDGSTLKLTDPTVSRFHLELEPSATGVVVRDLGSTNGTRLGNVALVEARITQPVELLLGHTRLRVAFETEHGTVTTSGRTELGDLVGQSAAMREVFAAIERAAPTSAPLLVSGESGTGKGLVARAIHTTSPRKGEPFETVDCGGLPANLIEDEIFGREAEGALQRADKGTLFLDEISELAPAVQPKLLRAIAESNVRIVASTSSDLRRQVNAGQFRADLYYRLAVVQIRVPPLRDRLDDLPLLVPALLDDISRDRGLDAHVEPDAALLASLARHSWPGNVRELRNYLEHLVILRMPPPLEPDETPVSGFGALDHLPLRVAKSQLLDRFERHYVVRLLAETGGNVAEAARRAGVDRVTLFRTIRRHGLKSHEP
jgi:two-component system, NtrC family, response regulator GlrR